MSKAKYPTTLDGRFAVLATITAIANVRLERDEDEGERLSVALAERFIEVMESEHRELGLGDPASAEPCASSSRCSPNGPGCGAEVCEPESGTRSKPRENRFIGTRRRQRRCSTVPRRCKMVAERLDGVHSRRARTGEASMTDRFAHQLRLDQIRDGDRLDLVADETERSAVARRLGLPSLDRLEAHVTLSRTGEMVRAEGRLLAALDQSCVVTGEPVAAHVDEPFALLFTPEPPVAMCPTRRSSSAKRIATSSSTTAP